MKKLSIYIIAIIIVVSSCKKDLNAPPSQAKVEGNVVIDQKSAELVLNGAYSRFANTAATSTGNTTAWTVFHEYFPASLAGWMQYFGGSSEQNNAMLPGSTASYWSLYYGLLNAANGVLKEAGDLADSKYSGTRKREILAEARFLRAYAHTSLLGYFSEWYKPESIYGVMLRKAPLQLTNAAQGRSTVKESYDFILADLDSAIKNAADTRPNYYANKTAARALKMRVLMLRGQGNDYVQVIQLANEITANTAYQLETTMKDLFQVKGLTSKEVILGITPYPGQVTRNSAYNVPSIRLSTPAFRELLANDPRKAWMYAKPVNPNRPTIKDSTYLTKYFGPKIEDVYVLRLTEIYLLKAEAIVRSGGSLSDARTILKDIEGRAGVTNFSPIDNATTPESMLLELYKEYSRNMVAEDGIEWFALLRLPFATVKQLRPTITEQKQYIMPIPATEFQLNPTIGEQNPGYPKL